MSVEGKLVTDLEGPFVPPKECELSYRSWRAIDQSFGWEDMVRCEFQNKRMVWLGGFYTEQRDSN